MNEFNFSIFFNKNHGKEKISFAPIAKDKHLTLHLGTKSKVLDIHIKNEKEINPEKVYNTLLKISHYRLKRILLLSRSQMNEILKKAFKEKINIGKLRKNQCILQPLVSSNISEILEINKTKTKIKFKKDTTSDQISSLFIEVDQMNSNTDIHFVYRLKKGQLVSNGIIFKRWDVETEKSFIYLSERAKRNLWKELTRLFLDIAESQNIFIKQMKV